MKATALIRARITQPSHVGTQTCLFLINLSLTNLGVSAKKFGFFANIPYPKLIDKVKISPGYLTSLRGLLTTGTSTRALMAESFNLNRLKPNAGVANTVKMLDNYAPQEHNL